jgi:serine/threonine-protein kinase
VAKITDFGIAKLPNAQLTQTGVVIGTPYFMSPEQLKGETVDGRSDLFSLGALLYNLVSGSRPFQGEEVAAVASQVLYKDPHPLSEVVPGVPAALDGVLGRALAKPPAERYASGEELAADLAAVRQGETPQGAPSVAERTQTSGAVAAPRGMDASAELPVLELEDAPAVDDSKVAPTARASVAVASPRRRLALWGALSVLLGLSLLSAVVFRQEIAEREQLFVASRAASNGELARSEEILETLLESNPELASARDLLGEVSGQLVGPMLPIELSVKHRHRFGSCSGRLTLSDDGVVFSSKSHGTWRWPFEHIRAFGARGAWEISLQTDEDDMLGLLDEKNYNFSLLGEAIDEDVAKRYERLYQYRRDRPTGL